MPLAPVKNRASPRLSRKARLVRRLKTGVVSVAAVAGVIAAGLYVLVWVQKPHALPQTTADASTQPKLPDLSAQKIGPNVPIGSAIQAISSPVTPGSNANVTLRTTEGAVCSLKVVQLDPYQKELARVSDSGLADKTADDYGMVTWTWTMPANAALTTWKADMFCKRGDKSTRSVGDIVVQKTVAN